MKNGKSVEVEVLNVALDPSSEGAYILFLRETSGKRVFPIWIGQYEAHAIYYALRNQKTERPMTHDLIKIILDALEVKIKSVVVNSLKDKTYFARLVLEGRDGTVYSIDARPSDSIAVAIRMSTKIYVSKDLMDEGGTVVENLPPSV